MTAFVSEMMVANETPCAIFASITLFLIVIKAIFLYIVSFTARTINGNLCVHNSNIPCSRCFLFGIFYSTFFRTLPLREEKSGPFAKPLNLQIPKNNQNLNAKFDEISNANPNAKFRCVRLEIGFGSGRHILYQANNNPDVFFIGIEIYKPAIEQVAKLAIAQNLNNVALLNCDARTFLQMLGSNSLDKIYLHFPVPWDDAPHRRVISYEFLQECEHVLRKGGIFELRSDSENYVKFALEKMMDFPRARVNIVKNEDLNITSKYEERWKRQQKDIYEVKFECVDDKAQEKLEFDFSFGRYSTNKIAQNFCNETLKFDDFFVHFEDIFYARNLDENGKTTNSSSNFKENEIFIKVSFGSFNAPTSHFILITDEI